MEARRQPLAASAAIVIRSGCLLLGLLACGLATAGTATRIVSLAPHLTELAYVAGAGDRLVGAVQYSDEPAEARALPRVGDAYQVDLERVLGLEPDLVLAWEAGTRDSLIEKLRSLGLNVATLPTFGIEDVGTALRQIGRLAGTQTTADRQALAFEHAIAQRRVAHDGKAPVSVFIAVDDRPLYTVNGRQLISQVVTLCGGTNVFGHLPQLAPTVGIEAVIAASPEVILSTENVDEQATALWAAWPQLPAVRNGNVHSVHADDIVRPTTRLTQGIDEVCGLLESARNKRRASLDSARIVE